MKKLIVNADDFGLTLGVCRGIIKAHQDGIVTSTTVLINSPHLDKALEILKTASSLEVGLHLNITWGKPVLPAASVKSLVDENGVFTRNKDFYKIVPEEAALEWEAQIHKAQESGLELTHLDTHHHTHLHPALLDILAELAVKYHLAARSPASWVRDFLKANSIPTTDSTILEFYGEGNLSVEHLQRLLRGVSDGFIEVMCHPGFVDDELKKISSYAELREEELRILSSSEWKEWLSEEEIVSSRFQEIPIPREAPNRSCDLIPDNP
jgi:predicted glycoside hydrolase/deacetylase ChbG (UPF0249 family)